MPDQNQTLRITARRSCAIARRHNGMEIGRAGRSCSGSALCTMPSGTTRRSAFTLMAGGFASPAVARAGAQSTPAMPLKDVGFKEAVDLLHDISEPLATRTSQPQRQPGQPQQSTGKSVPAESGQRTSVEENPSFKASYSRYSCRQRGSRSAESSSGRSKGSGLQNTATRPAKAPTRARF